MIFSTSCGCAITNIAFLIESTDQSGSLIFNFSTSDLNRQCIGTTPVTPWLFTSFAMMSSEAKCYPAHDGAVGNEARIAWFGSLDVGVLEQEVFVE